MENLANPFNITKAVHFSDREINDYWVDIPVSGGFVEMAKPNSPMPMFILGGKGSGKTHLMRYFSYPVQKIRYPSEILKGLNSEGYLGIYMLCGGLNSSRFKGKSQTEETWAGLFGYYIELWLGQLVISVLKDIFDSYPDLAAQEEPICSEFISLFDVTYDAADYNSFDKLSQLMRDLHRELDRQVNNCVLTCSLQLKIMVTRGSLIFGIPKIIRKYVQSLSDCLFVYIIDEFENLSADQQRYINTLIRENQAPCSIKIGSKLFGIRTLGTYCADEDNKEGSEYEALRLDSHLRVNPSYSLFAKRLVIRRLSEYVGVSESREKQNAMVSWLSDCFEIQDTTGLAEDATSFVRNKYKDRERPYFKNLKDQLLLGLKQHSAPGLSEQRDADIIVSRLCYPDFPLLEKINIFLFYKDWYKNLDLFKSSKLIESSCKAFIGGSSKSNRHASALDHFKSDMIAQLLRECDQKQRYLGIDTFIDMSSGIPRNLLVLLKHVTAWSLFLGERPFRGDPISIKAQEAGVSEASDWFFRDARAVGGDGGLIQDCIGRLATLFRTIRFSDKPVECSCITFSCDISKTTPEAQRIIDLTQKWSLLNDVGGQRDRNSERIDSKLQLNPMLSPRWDLSIYRRGVIALRPEEVNSIFDVNHKSEFDKYLKDRVARMTAPFFGKKQGEPSDGPQQLRILS
ncbi:MAG: hypothetical protein ACLQVJ_29335 [Syntrophobacteraceae bacterium]